ncbi:MAG: hypothetical protein FIA94_09380 [Nitrospirae bacterium]|nr:hypothetical protein [Nitrospirota bacterium]
MTEKWFDDMPDEGEKIYMEALAIVKAGLAKGLDFESACALVNIKDKALQDTVLDDVLKVIIAEEHFANNVPLEQVSRRLNLPIERMERARKEMFEDIEESAVDSFYKNTDHGTEH